MREDGFTLLEVLVAMAIMSLIATLVWSSQSATFNAGRKLAGREDLNRMGHLSVAKIESDLEAAYLFATPVHLGGGTRGDQWCKTEFVGSDLGDRDGIRLVSFAHQRLFKEAKESDQTEIAWQVVSRTRDGEPVEVLERREAPYVDTDSDDGGRWVPVAERVTAFNLEYWNLQSHEWIPQWNSTGVDSANKLPRAVRITLKLADPDRPDRTVTFKGVALIAMAPGPNDF